MEVSKTPDMWYICYLIRNTEITTGLLLVSRNQVFQWPKYPIDKAILTELLLMDNFGDKLGISQDHNIDSDSSSKPAIDL